MIYSKQKLQQEAASTGFRIEILEKVILLMDLLFEFATYPILKNKLVLKGGTALNLFYFNLPRLSVDIDLNYIGAVDREEMLVDREIIYSTINAICQRKGLALERNPTFHAGGKMVWRYPSALGQMANIEIDLNFMYRIPLWPVEFKSSCLVGTSQIHEIPVLNIHELSAGKLSAFINRKTGRDLFDTYHLLTQLNMDEKKLRLAFLIYSCMSRKTDLRKLQLQDISFNMNELKSRLVPLLRKDEINRIKPISSWTKNLVTQCQNAFHRLIPLTEGETKFLNYLLDHGYIAPELISNDIILIEKIKSHPALKWSAQNVTSKNSTSI